MFDYTKHRLKSAWYPFLFRRLGYNLNVSCSQFGEDAILNSLTSGNDQGTYVDVGVYHPVAFSNTYALYCRGWSGLTIEANPDVSPLFHLYRPRDRHVVTCVAPTAATELVPFTRFQHPVYSTFDQPRVEELMRAGEKVIDTIQIPARTLESVIDEYLGEKPIDLLSIDIEGIDDQVIASFPWQRHAPRIVVCEHHPDTDPMVQVLEEPFARILQSHGYDLVTRCGPSLIWRQKSG